MEGMLNIYMAYLYLSIYLCDLELFASPKIIYCHKKEIIIVKHTEMLEV